MANNIGIKGLKTFANELEYSASSQAEAENVVFDREGTLEPRRGFKQYGDALAATDDRVKQLLVYKGRILRHYDSTLQYDNGSGTFTNFTGSINEPESNIRLKGQEARSNFYFTSDTGIRKISASSAANISASSLSNAGGIEAVDLQAFIDYSQAGFFSADSKVVYRVVWGSRDANNNLILGSPSQRAEVVNRDASTSGVVSLTFTIPDDVVENVHFYQIYRSAVVGSTGFSTVDDIFIDDELQLVIEDFPTSSEISNGEVADLQDITPEDFRAAGLPLYTNVNSGEGLAQTNGRPPLAKDLALFKNSMFYANTKTVHQKEVDLLSITGFTSGTSDIIISDGDTTTRVVFRGVKEIGALVTVNKATTTASSYFLVRSPNDERTYYIWINKSGSDVDPNPDSSYIGIEVDISAVSTKEAVASAIKTACDADPNFLNDYTTDLVGTTLTDSNFAPGDVDVGADTITITDHDFYTGLEVQFSSSGSLPTGITGSTNYYIIYVDANTVQIASSFANAIAGTQIDITGAGSGTHTIEIEDSNIKFTAKNVGATTDITDGATSTSFNFVTLQQGDGEDATLSPPEALLSGLATVGQQIDDTARSLSRVINKQSSAIVTSTYISGASELPGQLLLKRKTLVDTPFYIATSDSNIASKFNPALPVAQSGTVATGAGTVTVSITGHGWSNGDEIIIYGSTSTPTIDGKYTITNAMSNSFDISATVTGGGNVSAFRTTEASDNEEAVNRLYFSKFQQPEAVPPLNFIEIGPKDSAIERIVPLRDSLFVFKEDGIYRVFGSVAPNFNSTLFDSSAFILSPDSAAVLNNMVYLLTTQGVIRVSEGGVPTVVSRDIEDKLSKLSGFSNTRTQSFGFTSETDRAYFLWVPQDSTDNNATTCLRYNTFTGGWTEWPIEKLAGIVNKDNDKIYLSPADLNKIEIERKDNTRKDYADREFALTLNPSGVSTDLQTLTISSTSGVVDGDILTQTQYLTGSDLNTFLRQLDTDPGLTDTNYYSTYAISPGDNLLNVMDNIATKLSADDSGASYSTSSSTDFETLQSDFNTWVTTLNGGSSDAALTYNSSSGTTEYESLITSVAFVGNTVNIFQPTGFLEGPITHYQAIATKITWVPQHFGNPEVLKQIAEGAIIVKFNNISDATISFSSDLEQAFSEALYEGQGNGSYGNNAYGTGTYGGQGQKIPLRIYIPRTKQRCRFLQPRFEHRNAFESFQVFGLTLSARQISTRAYR